MVKSLIAGNWKMNKNLDESIELIKALTEIEIKEGREVLICPPFISLNQAKELTKDSNIEVGAQNFYYEESGAYTGEVSAQMLKSVGASYVIVGHSERREIFKEDDELVNKKVKSAIENDLKPILCIGESEEQRNAGEHFDLVKSQLLAGLENLSAEDINRLVIAYEPVWAIGTGKTASSDDAEEMCAFIRQELAGKYGQEIADKVQILYGGSVKAATIDDLMSKANVNGALVGGASLDRKEFERIINYE